MGAENISLAILGIGNHRIPNYELPSNIPGLTFTDPITETQARTPALRVVGFALETGDLLARAAKKLRAKGMDFIVANDPTAPGSGFGDGPHRVFLLGPAGLLWDSGSHPKRDLARGLLDHLGGDAGQYRAVDDLGARHCQSVHKRGEDHHGRQPPAVRVVRPASGLDLQV